MGNSNAEQISRTPRTNLKCDKYICVGSKQILASDYFVRLIKQKTSTIPFTSYFNENTILVPASSRSLLPSNSLWAPERLANALVRSWLGNDSKPCLERITTVANSSRVSSATRPKVIEHYNSLGVQKLLVEPKEILVIDDIVTRGSTLFGSSNRLADAFPDAKIRGFALMQMISNSDKFEKIVCPCVGQITLRDDGWPLRKP